MRFGSILAGMIGALVLTGAAQNAAAQTRDTQARDSAPRTVVTLSEARQAQRRGLQLNDNGRWGLDFNFRQPVGREAQWGDVEAGAYYRLSPRLRVGAAAGLASPEADPARAVETDRRSQPRVRLESIFKF